MVSSMIYWIKSWFMGFIAEAWQWILSLCGAEKKEMEIVNAYFTHVLNFYLLLRKNGSCLRFQTIPIVFWVAIWLRTPFSDRNPLFLCLIIIIAGIYWDNYDHILNRLHSTFLFFLIVLRWIPVRSQVPVGRELRGVEDYKCYNINRYYMT